MKNVACFDIGGTFIKYAVINSEGEILFKDKFPTPTNNCNETIPLEISIKVNELKEKFQIQSVGVCSAGIVDSDNGIIIYSANLHNYSGTKISEIVKDKTGLNTFVENDGKLVALGEMWMGAAKGHKNFVSIVLGTGIGGAIVVDGKVIKGAGGAAGEIGHMIIEENGEKCGCGTIGCYERYASTLSLVRAYKKKAEENGTYIEYIDGEEIMRRVYNGESIANQVYDDFLNHLVTGLVNITHLLDPGLIVIGGGISAQGESFFKELNLKLKKRAMSTHTEHTTIVQAKLENDAGVYGACYRALNMG